MERVSARMTFRFITYGTKENIIALKETFVFRKQHGSCEHILNVVAALSKHLPLFFSISDRVKHIKVAPRFNNNNNTLFRFDYNTTTNYCLAQHLQAP